jgi:outer membrane protein TolC
MEFSVRDQVVRLETLQNQVDLFENVLILQAEETLRSTEAAYETGQLGVLDLLDSERFLLDVRLINARYYSDYLIALTHLERAIGTRFPR